MQVIDVFFIFLSALCLAGAITLLLAKDLLYAALGLLVVLLGVAGLFFIAGSEFLAVSQIMVYAGGVIVLILFGVMITNGSKSTPSNGIWKSKVVQLVLVGLLFSMFAYLGLYFWPQSHSQLLQIHHMPIRQIGFSLLGQYLLPFEFSIVLLLAALVGASVVAVKK